MVFLSAPRCAAVLAAVVTTEATAQGFDPRGNCGEVLRGASETDQIMIAAWTFGYIAANTDNVRPVDPSNNGVILSNIVKVCQANPQASLLELVAASAAKPKAPAELAAQPGSRADARQLLLAFLARGADHRALTQALLPTEAQVKAVYADPLGSALWTSYADQMGPGVAFVPKPGQTELQMIYATTRELFQRKPVLDEFPGGYKDVVQYFKIDVPIVRFRFVEPGKTLGLAFDGLIFLDGRWVIMPKPWRSL